MEVVSKTKGRCTKESLSNVVYCIPCKDCTKRLFGVRLKEHQKAVFTGDIEKSALAEDVLNPRHAIDWSNVTTDLLPVSRPMPAFGVVVCTKPTSDLNRELYWTLMGRH